MYLWKVSRKQIVVFFYDGNGKLFSIFARLFSSRWEGSVLYKSWGIVSLLFYFCINTLSGKAAKRRCTRFISNSLQIKLQPEYMRDRFNFFQVPFIANWYHKTSYIYQQIKLASLFFSSCPLWLCWFMMMI